jgi:hypothetical protein
MDRQFNISPPGYARLQIAKQQVWDMISNLHPSYGTISADEAYEYSTQLVSAAKNLLRTAEDVHGQVLDRLNEIEDAEHAATNS